jgi:hypothetical protein
MSAWLNWIERLTSNQEVVGSSPTVDLNFKIDYIYEKE